MRVLDGLWLIACKFMVSWLYKFKWNLVFAYSESIVESDRLRRALRKQLLWNWMFLERCMELAWKVDRVFSTYG